MKTNALYLGDCLDVLPNFPDESVDLVYIDPPFFTQRKHRYRDTDVGFDDLWEGGVNSYIRWLVPRLRACHRLLKDDGVFCLHLDQSSSHYAKVELDKIFGKKNFLNEIIWAYKSGGSSKKMFSKKHDTILVYTKSNRWTFNVQKEKSYNREFKAYKFKDVQESFDELGACKSAASKCKLWYTLVNQKDIFNIDMVGRTSAERLGYPTQKPLALLEKLINAFTNKGDIVADFFCGSGTTLHAAHNLKRRWIGIDENPQAIEICKNRLGKN